MKDLKYLREELDNIDKDMAELFEKRMEVIKDVKKWKENNNYPIYDASRESSMLDKNLKHLKDKELAPYYKIFLEGVTTSSKEYMKANKK